jgi:CRISPR-associated protein Csm4
MKDYAVKLKLLSPTGTPWQSDTMMGHMAWQVSFGKCDLEIDEFLLLFNEYEPPFVLSDGFPEGFFPRPLLSVPGASIEADTLGEYEATKQWQKAPYLTIEDFKGVCRGQESKGEPRSDPWLITETLHAVLDRNIGTAVEPGGLYATESRVLPDEIEAVTYYLRVQEDWYDRAISLFHEVGKVGYGRDKSVGLGQFEVIEVEECNLFSAFDRADGFVSLSSYVPAENDPNNGRWSLRIKRGKLGEHAGGQGNPFKKPIIQFEPGAVFRTGERPKPWYGRVVKNVAPGMPEAVQICYTLSVPCIFK